MGSIAGIRNSSSRAGPRVSPAKETGRRSGRKLQGMHGETEDHERVRVQEAMPGDCPEHLVTKVSTDEKWQMGAPPVDCSPRAGFLIAPADPVPAVAPRFRCPTPSVPAAPPRGLHRRILQHVATWRPTMHRDKICVLPSERINRGRPEGGR
jgi:hypothetical protein